MTNVSIISGSAIQAKQALREQLERDVAEFKANNGKIEQLKQGESGVHPKGGATLAQRRKPHV